jgi:SHS2 domain-containing protein
VELEIEGPDEAAVFQDAAVALGELLGAADQGEPVTTTLEVTAPDRAALLAEMMSELLFRAESERFVPVTLGSIELREGGLRATVHGRRAEPSALVKAVTYHRLCFEPAGNGFRAGVVLDV